MSERLPSPFGPAVFKARARTSVLPMETCASPVELFERLSRRHPDGGGRGAVLMESAAQGAPAGVRSLVVPQGLIRLVIRGSQAHFSPLTSRALPLMEVLRTRLPKTESRGDSLVARFPDFDKDPAVPDAERVRAASVLDGVRALAGLVEDEDPEEDLLPPGLYGAFSYEAVDLWEELPPRRPDPLGEPDVNLVFALDTISFDHVRREVRVVSRSPGRPSHDDEDRHRSYVAALEKNDSSPPGGFGDEPVREKEAEADVSDEAFTASVEKFLSHVLAGDIFQGVLSRGLWMKSAASPLAVYRALRSRNPSPYMFYVDLGHGELLGASPETCLKVERGQVMIRPIAGTAPRGIGPDGAIDEELDARLAVSLLLDTKEQAEHAMLVDLARNDVARVSVPGTRQVTDPFCVEKYSHVQHLVSGVRGTLLPDLDALHAYVASANMGTLTGAPKLRAMELIRETEPNARGYYGGAVGYLLQDGTFDSCIVIRTLRHRNGDYLTRTGAGIVADSIPERELEETIHKARACRVAIALAERAQP